MIAAVVALTKVGTSDTFGGGGSGVYICMEKINKNNGTLLLSFYFSQQ